MSATKGREAALTMYGFMDGQTTREDGASRASVASICRYWADEMFDNLDGEATAALRFCLTRAADLLTVPTLDAGKVSEAEEQVRKDASDRMQHNTTADLSARLMCRVGFRELTLLLAHYDGLKRAHAASLAPAIPEGWVMVPVEPTEAMLAKGHHMIDWSRTDQPTNTNDNPLQKPGGVGTNCKEDLRDAWRAMIDARPLPTEEEGGA